MLGRFRARRLAKRIEQFIIAARRGDLAKVVKLTKKSWLSRGVDVNSRAAWDGDTALHVAVGNPSLIKCLLSMGADVHSKNAGGETPLHAAVTQGQLAAAELLIAHGASVNVFDNKGLAPVDLAHSDIMVLLFNSGAGEIHNAARTGDIDFVRQWMNEGPRGLRCREHNSDCPIILALANDNEEIARMLVPRLGHVTCRDSYGNTALHLAAAKRHREATRQLLEQGASVNVANTAGETPFTIARTLADEETVALLAAKCKHDWKTTPSNTDPCKLVATCAHCRASTLRTNHDLKFDSVASRHQSGRDWQSSDSLYRCARCGFEEWEHTHESTDW